MKVKIKRGYTLTALMLSIVWMLSIAGTIRADDISPLAAPVCALVSGALNCYTPPKAAVIAIAPADAQVIDFAVSMDGEWIVYRTAAGVLTVRGIYDTRNAIIDNAAPPPATFDPDADTLAWAPNGLAIAYITSDGLRVAFPGAQVVNITDRLYGNLRFSPSGNRLAAQDSGGRWKVFSIQEADAMKYSLSPVGTFDRASEAAWMDDNSLIVAPYTGGLLRLNIVEAALSPTWEKQDGLFTRLTHTYDNHVYAIQLDPGDSIGLVMAISGDGTLKALGDGKVDRRVGWVSNGSSMMVYMTSGTPILVDPATGYEDALPVDSVSRLAWAAPFYIDATSLSLDSDLYFLAPDENNQRQVWLLPGDGLNQVSQVTRIPGGVVDYGLSPDRKQVAVTTATTSQLALVPLPDLPTATSTIGPSTPTRSPRLTPTSSPSEVPGVPGSRILDKITLAEGAQPDWSLDGRQIVYRSGDGIYVIDAILTNSTPQKIASFQAGKPFLQPRFSPDRRFVLLQGPDARVFDALPLQSGTPRIQGTPFDADLAVWGLNALFHVRTDGKIWTLSAADTDGTAELARSSGLPIRAVRPLGGSPGVAGQSAVFFRTVGWDLGPDTIQLCAASGNTGTIEVRGVPMILQDGIISLTGRYAAGTSISSNGKMRQLVILDLQNGSKVAIRSTQDVSGLRWSR